MINYVSVAFTNAVMTCSLASTSDIVGANTTYTFSYTPLVSIAAGSILQLNLDPWGAFKESNFITTSPDLICSNLCTITTPASNNNISETLRYSSLYSADVSTASSLQLAKAKNPASTRSISLSASLITLSGNI